jgi:hypothetical protein
LAFVTKNGKNLNFASDELKKDEDVVLAALKDDPESIIFVDEELLQNKEFLLKAVKSNAMKQIPKGMFMNEKEFVLKLVQIKGIMLKFASENLRDDKEIVLGAVGNWNSLSYASERLRNDEEVVLQTVKLFPSCIHFIKDNLQTNEFLIKAIRLHPEIINDKSTIDHIELFITASKWFKLIREVNTFNLNFKFE